MPLQTQHEPTAIATLPGYVTILSAQVFSAPADDDADPLARITEALRLPAGTSLEEILDVIRVLWGETEVQLAASAPVETDAVSLAPIARALELPSTATLWQILDAIARLQASQPSAPGRRGAADDGGGSAPGRGWSDRAEQSQQGQLDQPRSKQREIAMSQERRPLAHDIDAFSLWRSLTDTERRKCGDFECFANAFHVHRVTSRPSSSRSTARKTVDLSVLKAEWRANLPNEHGVHLQEEYGDEEAFVAFRRHEAAGDVVIHTRPGAANVTALSAEERDDPNVQKFYELQRRGLATIVGRSPGRIDVPPPTRSA